MAMVFRAVSARIDDDGAPVEAPAATPRAAATSVPKPPDFHAVLKAHRESSVKRGIAAVKKQNRSALDLLPTPRVAAKKADPMTVPAAPDAHEVLRSASFGKRARTLLRTAVAFVRTSTNPRTVPAAPDAHESLRASRRGE